MTTTRKRTDPDVGDRCAGTLLNRVDAVFEGGRALRARVVVRGRLSGVGRARLIAGR